MHMIKYEEVKSKILTIRDQKVIIDSDVAQIYGVETKVLNQAVSRNLDKFPDGYIFELTEPEWIPLRSQFVTSIKVGEHTFLKYSLKKACICWPQSSKVLKLQLLQ